MSALTAARIILVPDGTIKKTSFPLKAGAKAFENGMCCIDTASAATVVQGQASTTLIPIGKFIETKDNTLGAGTLPIGVNLNRERLISYWDSVTGAGAITAANLFSDVYIADDQTLTTSSGGNSKYGKVWIVSPQGYPGGVGAEPVF